MAARQWVYVILSVSLCFGVCFSNRVIMNKQVEKPKDVEITGGLEENNSSSNIDVDVEKYPAFVFKDPLASASDPSSESGNNTIVSTSRSGPISGSEKLGSNKECCSNNNCESCNNNNCESCSNNNCECCSSNNCECCSNNNCECCSNNICGCCKRCQSSEDCQSCDDCQSCKRCQSSNDCQICGPTCGPRCGPSCSGCQTCGSWQSRNNPPSITIPGFTVPIRGLKCTPIDCCPGCDCNVIHMYFNHGDHTKKANVQDDLENTMEQSDDKEKQDTWPLNSKVKQDSMPISSTSEPSPRSEAGNSNVEEIYGTYDNQGHDTNSEENNVEAMPPMFI